METIRGFFASEGFVEIETPLLVAAPGMEPHLTPFKTILHTPTPLTPTLSPQAGRGGIGAYLITSPEYSCKKMLAAGIPKLFSLGKVFRNQEPFGPSTALGVNGKHNPEFTMIEWYRAGVDYTKIMEDTEWLVRACVDALGQEARITYQGKEIDLTSPWERLSVKNAFARVGLNLDQCLTRDTMAEAARKKGYTVTSNDSFDDCFFKIFLTEIEPHLGQGKPLDTARGKPTILYDYPVQMAALARAKPDDGRYAERFEVYVNGLELANAFSELTDADEQRRRLEEERALRGKLRKDQPPIDEDFLSALREMPAAAGIALGVDRLVTLLTDAKSIEDVMLFPASDLFM